MNFKKISWNSLGVHLTGIHGIAFFSKHFFLNLIYLKVHIFLTSTKNINITKPTSKH